MLRSGSFRLTGVTAGKTDVTVGFIIPSVLLKSPTPEDAGGWQKHRLPLSVPASITEWRQSLSSSVSPPAAVKFTIPQVMKLRGIILRNTPARFPSPQLQFFGLSLWKTEPAPAGFQLSATSSTKIILSRLSALWQTVFPSFMVSTIPEINLSNAEGVSPLSRTILRFSSARVLSGSKGLLPCWIASKRTTVSISQTATAVRILKGWICLTPV